MKDYVVVYKDTHRAATFVKGDKIRLQDGQLQILGEDHGIIYVTPLDLIHHVRLADKTLVNFDGTSE